MTQPALEASSCAWYLGLLRKLSWLAVATSKGAKPEMTRDALPCNSPPSDATTDAKSSCIARTLYLRLTYLLAGIFKILRTLSVMSSLLLLYATISAPSFTKMRSYFSDSATCLTAFLALSST